MNKLDFRAYDPIKNKMSYDVTLYANGWTEVVYYDGEETKYKPNELIIMQYSGVKTTNEKQIFEGDIVKVRDMPSSPHEKTYITQVTRKDGCFFLADIDGSEVPLYSTQKESYPNGYYAIIIEDIIDNIYEKRVNITDEKLAEAKRIFKEELLNTYMMVTMEHEKKINNSVNKIIDNIYNACMESLNRKENI